MYVPNTLIQGQVYLSVDYPLAVVTATAAVPGTVWAITPPSFVSNADANYYHLYDSFQFLTNKTTNQLTIPGNYINSFALPISVLTTFNEGFVTYFLGLPPSVPRDDGTTGSVFGQYTHDLEAIGYTSSLAQWGPLSFSFTPAGNTGATSYLRLLSPLQQLGSNIFKNDYLFNTDPTVYGADWFTYVFDTFYSANPLYLDVSSLATPGAPYTTYHFLSYAGGIVTFAPDGFGSNVTIQPSLTPIRESSAFFNNTPLDFHVAGDPVAGNPICTYLSAGFVTGIFPRAFSSSNPLSYTYIQQQYVSDPATFWTAPTSPSGGPWYNLYGAVLHNLSPFVEPNNYSNNAANSVDTSIGFFSPILAPLTSDPYVTVSLGNMEHSEIPNFSDPREYTVLFNPGVGANYVYNGISIIGGGPTLPTTTATLPIDLLVTYTTGSYSGLTYTTQIYINGPTVTNYAVVFPHLPAQIIPHYDSISGQWLIGAGAPN